MLSVSLVNATGNLSTGTTTKFTVHAKGKKDKIWVNTGLKQKEFDRTEVFGHVIGEPTHKWERIQTAISGVNSQDERADNFKTNQARADFLVNPGRLRAVNKLKEGTIFETPRL